WQIGKNKPFFIGSRSLDIIQKKPTTRRLVGLSFREDQPSPMPSECHLIIADGEIAGRITSIAPRSTLGRPIAMAFVTPELAAVGTRVEIRVDDGCIVEAHVAKIPFYDPQSTRQQ
ncbi:MAG: glycine cleavage T C-terminal barrel domain-containing protein, partial [Planctomycetaceae bacterium]